MPPLAVPVTLTAAERKTLKKRVRGARHPTGTGCGRRSYWPRPAAGARIAADLGISRTPRVSGGAGSRCTAWAG